MKRKIFFLRHLKTSNNKNNLINGRSLYLNVEKEKPINSPYNIDSIYCSPALRCRQTVDCYVKTSHDIPIQFTELLYERDMGIWEGKLKSSVISDNPDLFIDGKFNLFLTPPAGEAFNDFKRRVTDFLNLINKEEGNLLICSHNQFLKLLMLTLCNIMLTQKIWNAIDFPYGEVLSLEELLLKYKISNV